ncbi:MAG: HNH endonuclease [Phycisphaerales bacterium JB060]
MSKSWQELPEGSRVRLDNAACAYCHKPFDAQFKPEQEHVIGRRFVPKGSLAGQWNVIVNSCRACNEAKSRLENDLSAIIMRPEPWGRDPPDTLRIEEARRKESSRSARTGKAVRDSSEEFRVSHQIMPGVQMSVNFVSGPQFEPHRANQLACFQISALFYWLTYNQEQRRGAGIPHGFWPINGALRPDWGNALLRGFQDQISDWPWRVHAIGADGYFKAIIRRHPDEAVPLWAWALEWNKSYRSAGYFGDLDAAQALCNALPPLKRRIIERGVDSQIGPFESSMREEVALPPEDDTLFDQPPDAMCA